MNKTWIIGNLTADPDLRTTQSGLAVCQFTVAVNRRKEGVDYFRVTAWRQLAEICGKFLAKGRTVSVVGSVSVSTYQTHNGDTKASLDLTADDVEFLTPRDEEPIKPVANPVKNPKFVEVQEELPF